MSVKCRDTTFSGHSHFLSWNVRRVKGCTISSSLVPALRVPGMLTRGKPGWCPRTGFPSPEPTPGPAERGSSTPGTALFSAPCVRSHGPGQQSLSWGDVSDLFVLCRHRPSSSPTPTAIHVACTMSACSAGLFMCFGTRLQRLTAV